MATIRSFEDLEIWQESRIICNKIFEIINENGFERDFKLRDQINGSSGSMMDNIAEGFERDGQREFIQFLSIAKGSSGEVKLQLYRAMDRKYITKEKFDELYKMTDITGKKIGNFMKYLSKTEFRGNKFKEPENIYHTQNNWQQEDY